MDGAARPIEEDRERECVSMFDSEREEEREDRKEVKSGNRMTRGEIRRNRC